MIAAMSSRQILVRQLKFGDAVLVVQRDRVPVVNRLLEVVDRDVVAEDFLRPFFSGDQRRAREADERSVRAERSAYSVRTRRTGSGALHP